MIWGIGVAFPIEDFPTTFEAMKQDYISARGQFEDVDIEFCYDTAKKLTAIKFPCFP
ncbi:MAG: hypothetical protein ACI3YY_08420 [Candidatus Cryptobacteroides sp.]